MKNFVCLGICLNGFIRVVLTSIQADRKFFCLGIASSKEEMGLGEVLKFSKPEKLSRVSISCANSSSLPDA